MQATKLCQFFTPEWASQQIVEQYFGNLTSRDLVIEPSVGLGSFLKAIPMTVPAIGVEIDPRIAELARQNTGRTIITGDFRTVPLKGDFTTILGNPPFHVPTIEGFLRRALRLMPEGGRCGFILPAYAMQTHSRVMGWHKHWSIQSDIIPRRLFPRLRLPLLFVLFTKERERKMTGFALYRQALDIDNMDRDARETAEKGKPRRGVWRALVEATLEKMGGEATLKEIYGAIEPRRPTANSFWREKVRQVLQMHFESPRRGRWRMPQQQTFELQP